MSDKKDKRKKAKDKRKKTKGKKDKKVKVKAKRTRITTQQNMTESLSDKMINQKPIITRTNPLQQVQQFVPQGFGSMATVDQRNNDVLRGQFNDTQNKLINVERVLKKERSDAQKQGDIDKANTWKAKRHIKDKRNENEDFKTLGEVRGINTMRNIFSAWKTYKDDERPNKIAQVESSSLGRDEYKEHNYFHPDDNIDVVPTIPELKSDDYIERGDEDLIVEDNIDRGHEDLIDRGHKDNIDGGHEDNIDRGHEDNIDRGHEDHIDRGHEDLIDGGHEDLIDGGHEDLIVEDNYDSLKKKQLREIMKNKKRETGDSRYNITGKNKEQLIASLRGN